VRNAVLILHGTTGSGEGFLAPRFAGELFGPGQPLDTAQHFLVLPDGIGHGGSSKPSDALRARFPRYGYADMVEAQRRLLVEHLGVTHLRAVIGTSMGAMHAWVWATTHPDFVDGIVPLAAVPTQIAGRNRMWRKLMIDYVRTDPAWQGGDYTAQPPGLKAALGILWLVGTAPIPQQRATPTRDAADSAMVRWMANALPRYDANDLAYAVEASWDYDPSPHLARVRAPVLAINSADDLINPPDLGLMETLLPRVPSATRYVLLPASERTRGHGTHSEAALWKATFAEWWGALPRR
jgi:homoserine O-acetyltransferase